jgi:hypothetical protein
MLPQGAIAYFCIVLPGEGPFNSFTLFAQAKDGPASRSRLSSFTYRLSTVLISHRSSMLLRFRHGSAGSKAVHVPLPRAGHSALPAAGGGGHQAYRGPHHRRRPGVQAFHRQRLRRGFGPDRTLFEQAGQAPTRRSHCNNMLIAGGACACAMLRIARLVA